MTHSLIEQINEIRSHGFRPGIVGCFVHQKKVLFMYDKQYNLWQLPQGGIDNNEDVRDAVQREMKEEVGEFLTKYCTDDYVLVGRNKVEFPPKNHGKRELQTDAGQSVLMRGKFYFFVRINAHSSTLHLEKTEFDDYKWLSYAEAKKEARSMYQRGKQRVTLFALDILKQRGDIE